MQTITLNNGVHMPMLGLGVFQAAPETTAAAVQEALRLGYRLIDTAAIYGNEREVGEGIRRAGIARDALFIETKVWINDYGYDETLHAFDKSAGKLGVETIDLLLLHQPLSSRFERTLGAYQALEQLLADGKVGAIGVSNFMPQMKLQMCRKMRCGTHVFWIELATGSVSLLLGSPPSTYATYYRDSVTEWNAESLCKPCNSYRISRWIQHKALKVVIAREGHAC